MKTEPEFVAIKFPNGMDGLVDAEDWKWLSKYAWACSAGKTGNKWYAKTSVRKPDGKATMATMHRMIMQPPIGRHVDHKNGNSLDNRRENLRLCGASENLANRILKPKVQTSKYRGVSTSGMKQRPWGVAINVAGKHKSLGHYASEDLAALEYDIAAIEEFGEFARPNFPRDLVAYIVRLRRAGEEKDSVS